MSRNYLSLVTEKQDLAKELTDVSAKLKKNEDLLLTWQPKVAEMREEYKQREEMMKDVILKMRAKFEQLSSEVTMKNKSGWFANLKANSRLIRGGGGAARRSLHFTRPLT